MSEMGYNLGMRYNGLLDVFSGFDITALVTAANAADTGATRAGQSRFEGMFAPDTQRNPTGGAGYPQVGHRASIPSMQQQYLESARHGGQGFRGVQEGVFSDPAVVASGGPRFEGGFSGGMNR
jgi:hypothetical protein